MNDDKAPGQTAEPTPSQELSDEESSQVAGGTGGPTSEEQSLRLQQSMERQSKLETTLSNILERHGSAEENIVRNLK
jgi:hypothetical protein